MTTYTAINQQVFTDEAKVLCVCQNNDDALLVAQALNDLDAMRRVWGKPTGFLEMVNHLAAIVVATKQGRQPESKDVDFANDCLGQVMKYCERPTQ